MHQFVLVFLSLVLLNVTARPWETKDVIDLGRLGSVAVHDVPGSNRFMAYTSSHWDHKAEAFATGVYGIDLSNTRVYEIIRPEVGVSYGDLNIIHMNGQQAALFYVSTKSGSSQIWYTVVSDHEASEHRQVSDYPLDVSNLKFHPNKKMIAFSASTFANLDMDETRKEIDRRSNLKHKTREYDKLMIRHWSEWRSSDLQHGPLYDHVYTQEIQFHRGVFKLKGKPFNVMHGINANCGPRPFSGAEAFNFHPTEPKIVLNYQLDTQDYAWNTDWNIFMAPVNQTKPHQCITCQNRARKQQPSFSADGKKLFYLTMSREQMEADKNTLVMLDLETGQVRRFLDAWTKSPDSYYVDGNVIYFTATDRGHQRLFSMPIDRPFGEPISFENGSVLGIVTVVDDNAYVLSSDWNRPNEVFVINTKTAESTQVTHVNTKFLSEIDKTIIEEMWLTTSDGTDVQGWILSSPHLDKGQEHPAILTLHGGPQGFWGSPFSYRWPVAVFAAHYPIILVNPRGSTGYSTEFTDAVSGRWCNEPLMVDDMEFLTETIKKFDWIDGSRIGIMGASYGGFSTNFLVNTGKFKAAVSHCGLVDFTSFYYTTEELFFAEHEFGGSPMDPVEPESYKKCSPINYINDINTPMLLIHGDNDFRIDKHQNMMLFQGLQRRGVPSRLVFFERGSHWVTHPLDWLHWMDIIFHEDGWFKKYL
ncbi:hypothetical protein P9112_009140 [Eukaryota sp. TZLM1-RC]